MHKRPFIKILLSTLAVLPLAGCLLRTSHPAQLRLSTANLREATLEELIDSINTNAARWQSLQASVDIDGSIVERKKGKVTLRVPKKCQWPLQSCDVIKLEGLGNR